MMGPVILSGDELRRTRTEGVGSASARQHPQHGQKLDGG